jgi:hypothetical protein
MMMNMEPESSCTAFSAGAHLQHQHDDSNQKRRYRGKRWICCGRTTNPAIMILLFSKPTTSQSPSRGGGGGGIKRKTTTTTTASGLKYLLLRPYVTVPLLLIVGTVVVQRLLSLYMGHRQLLPAPIVQIHRECPALSYLSITEQRQRQQQQAAPAELPPPPIICMTTLTDHASKSTFQRFIRWRNFDSILNLTMSNKQSYVDQHANYRLYDGSHLIDPSRPPAWTKVRALQYLLDVHVSDNNDDNNNKRCDWIVWMDADTVIMNMDIAWEDFLPTTTTTTTTPATTTTTVSTTTGTPATTLSTFDYSLVIGSDKGGGYNSGVFALRNNDWTRQFLQHWWDMTDFVRPPGLALSGDNASLKHYLAQLETSGEFAQHVIAPPRCRLNSFAVLLSPAQHRYAETHLDEFRSTWYMSADYYHAGDFIAHFPGIDNKELVLQMFLDLAAADDAAKKKKKATDAPDAGGNHRALRTAPN